VIIGFDAVYCLHQKILAEVALKVRLLDITGDGIEIPEKVSLGPGKLFVDDDADV
jgi:hypothetical protein